MKKVISIIADKPWIVFLILTILFFISMIYLIYSQKKRKKLFKQIKIMKEDGILSKVYLRIDHGYGDFYDVKVTMDGRQWYDAPFSDEIMIPSLLLLPGYYQVQFSIKVRSGVSPYYKKKGPFCCELVVEDYKNTVLVFDNDTLASWQEDYEEDNL